MKGLLENRKNSLCWAASFGLFLLVLGCFASCLPSKFSLPPLPSIIESMEGYGSLRITGDQGTSKTKFSFLFFLPHKGRIESFDILGRSLYYILIDEEKSFFVLPSKKVYWEGDVEEVIYRFLGFRLDQYEMISLLRGHWTGVDPEAEKGLETWNFEKDERGRILVGRRGDFRFEIQEFFGDSQFARILLFHHPLSEGRLKILKINFNKPIKLTAFSRRFLKKHELKTWDEIEKLLENES